MKVDSSLIDARLSRSVEGLCRKHHVLRLSLFGSGAAGKLESQSDLDFMVEFEALSPGQHADAYFGLLSDLEELFHRRIDLLERSAIENPYLLTGIEKSRLVVYEAA